MSSQYLLIPQRLYSTPMTGVMYEIGNRLLWDIALTVSELSVGGSLTVDIETSPTGTSDSWTSLVSFAGIATNGTFTKTSRPSSDPPIQDFTIGPIEDVYFRAKISAITGSAVVEVTATTAFFYFPNSAHSSMLAKELREWESDRDRIINLAEQYVMSLIVGDEETGEFKVDIASTYAMSAILQEIALEANWQFKREIIARSNDPSLVKSYLDMPLHYPGFGSLIGEIISGGGGAVGIWYGR